jgi:fibronectin-binding autotransporter adhesin
MRKIALIAIIVALGAGAMQAQAVNSYWTGAVDNLFTNAGNWSAGVPNSAAGIDGVVTNNPTITLDDDLNAPTSERVRKVNIESGTLDIVSGGNFQTVNGGTPQLKVGMGSGNVGTLYVRNGGNLNLLGIAADLLIGEVGGAQGFVVFEDGATIRASKATEIRNGTLTIESGVISGGSWGDELYISDTGTFAFKTDGTNNFTVAGSSLALMLDAGATLDMQLGGAYSIGDSWTIMTDIDPFSGTFGAVVDSTNPGNNFKVHYGSGLASAGEVVVELIPSATEFTDSSGDGTWANAANWTAGVPTLGSPATVNSNLTANLSGGTGSAASLSVGTVANASGTVQNGSLNVAGSVEIGSAANATGTVSVTSYNGGTSIDDLSIATAAASIGSLVAGSGTLIAKDLFIASGDNAAGTLSLSSGSITVAGAVNIATGQDSTAATVAGTSIVMASTNGLFVGAGSGSSHNFTASNFSITGPIGDFAVGEGTGSSIKSLFSANDSLGSLTANSALDITGGNHDIVNISVASESGTTGSVSFAGTASGSFAGSIRVVGETSANDGVASLDLSGLVSGAITSTVVSVGRGDRSVASLVYTNGNLHRTGDMEVGSNGTDAHATVLLKSMTGNNVLSVCNTYSGGATGTVTVVEDAEVGVLRVARADNSVGSVDVGGTLTVQGYYLNAAGLGSGATGTISAKTLNKTSTAGNVQIAQGDNTVGTITAEDGALSGGGIEVAKGDSSVGVFAVTNGTYQIYSGSIDIASGSNSVGNVIIAISSQGTNDVKIGAGTDSSGSLTMPGGSLVVSNLQIGASGFVDVTIGGTIDWIGKGQADFEALWATGQLRSAGATGPSSSFFEYFNVTGSQLKAKETLPIGDIAISSDGSNVTISWDTQDGQSYDLRTDNNLAYATWAVYTNVTGTGGEVTVEVPISGPAEFYKVTSD